MGARKLGKVCGNLARSFGLTIKIQDDVRRLLFECAATLRAE